MVSSDSHRISRAPCYSGNTIHGGHDVSPTGVSPTVPGLPRPFGYTTTFSLHPQLVDQGRPLPQPRTHNPYQVSHAYGLAIIRFRSPLLTEYLFLWVLRCFTSPRSSHTGYLTHQQVTPHYRCWVPPFRNPRINTRSSTPRGISQTATSFISS